MKIRWVTVFLIVMTWSTGCDDLQSPNAAVAPKASRPAPPVPSSPPVPRAAKPSDSSERTPSERAQTRVSDRLPSRAPSRLDSASQTPAQPASSGRPHWLQDLGYIPIDGTTGSGKPFEWDAYRGKVVLVQFWASWCPACRQSIPVTKKVYQKYRDRGFEVVGINVDADRSKFTTFKRQAGIQWPNIVGLLSVARLSKKFRSQVVPQFFLANKEGRFIAELVHTSADGLRPKVARPGDTIDTVIEYLLKQPFDEEKSQ